MEAEEKIERGYVEAVELLRACSTPEGFVASPSETTNYHRIWGWDGAIISLAALLTEEPSLIDSARRTFKTLAEYQGIHGEIPSNVDPASNRISYGGTIGRVDSDLWFIIGCGEYWQATGDDDFLAGLLPAIEKVRFLLGDWADEYLHHGYVLYDQLLYLQAQRTLARIHAEVHGSHDHALQEKISRLRHLIQANYWFEDDSRREVFGLH